jgi:apolipoprotein N-acyltransferase
MSRIADASRDVVGHAAAKTAKAIGPRLKQWLTWCRPGLASGFILWLSFPPVGWSLLAWVALVPLLTLLRVPWRSRPIYGPAWAGGLVFGLLAVQWIRLADDTGLSGYYGWWALALYLSLYFPAFLFVLRIAVLRFRVATTLAAPVVWVGLEWLRSWFATGFPWYYLAHSQYRWLTLIQISDLTGAYGVSFLVALVNAWLVDLLAVPLMQPGPRGSQFAPAQLWRAGLVVAAFVATLGYGAIRVQPARDAGDEVGVRIALIQTNVPQKVKVDETQLEFVELQNADLLGRAIAERPQLIIWPETSFLRPLVTVADDVTDDDLRRIYASAEIEPSRVREYSQMVTAHLQSMARATPVPMLVGVNAEYIDRNTTRMYNSALLVTPAGKISPPYHKVHLVPWGEYLPLRRWLPFLRLLTPHSSADYGLEAGRDRAPIEFGPHRLGVLICFEDTVPAAAREYARAGTNVLVNISNDGWFAGSSELDVHLAISVFRAVECRLPLVRAVNTGISAFIDPTGRVVARAGEGRGSGKLIEDVLVQTVTLANPYFARAARPTAYVRAGDWLAITCFALSACTVLTGVVLSIRRVRAA